MVDLYALFKDIGKLFIDIQYDVVGGLIYFILRYQQAILVDDVLYDTCARFRVINPPTCIVDTVLAGCQ